MKPIKDLKLFYAWCAIFKVAKKNRHYRKQLLVVMADGKARTALKALLERNADWTVTSWSSRNLAYSKELHINKDGEAVVRDVQLYEEPLFKVSGDKQINR